MCSGFNLGGASDFNEESEKEKKKKINKNKIHLIVSAITSSQEAFIKACICKCEKVICERKKKGKKKEKKADIILCIDTRVLTTVLEMSGTSSGNRVKGYGLLVLA